MSSPQWPGAAVPEGVNTASSTQNLQDVTEESAKNAYRDPIQAGILAARAAAMERMVLQPFSYLIAWLLDEPVENWDSIAELRDNLIPAIIRRILGPLGTLFSTGDSDDIDSGTKSSLLGNIPLIGPLAQAITGVAGGAISTISGFMTGLTNAAKGTNPGSGTGITSVITSIFGFQSATANTATTAASTASAANSTANTALSTAESAVEEAVDTVAAAMNEIVSGNIVSGFASVIFAAVQAAFDAIFGSGGSTWSQEVYLTSSQLQLGPNDIPLGFRMGFGGRITGIYVRVLANNATSGSAIIQVRKNASSFTSITLSTTDTSKSATVNVTCNAGDIIDFNCTQVPSAGTIAGISVSVIGRYN